jgi:cyclophilin family peptidyl-prolyl cis-trans isomerase
MPKHSPVLLATFLLMGSAAIAQDSRPSSRPAGQAPARIKQKSVEEMVKGLKDGLYSVVETNKGTIVLQLHYDKVPVTVANYVGLATGNIAWIDPKTKERRNDPFYDGLTFHRIIKDFMVQGGCPLGSGSGGPGYQFSDEFHPDLKHSGPGILSMARTSQPGTNGSQFFLTLKATPWLDNKHSVFGKLVEGMEVLKLIGGSETQGARGSPLEKIVMNKVTIHRVGEKAKAWDISSVAAKSVPDIADELIDPARVWNPKGEKVKTIKLQFIVIQWKDIAGVHPLCPYNKGQAKLLAQKVVRVARAKGASFNELELRFSDSQTGGQAYEIDGAKDGFPEALKPVLTLKQGQISDPLEGPQGFMIFYAPQLIEARHILISFKGSEIKEAVRTKVEAKAMIDDLLVRLNKKEIKWDDALKGTDTRAAGGKLGTFSRENMVKPFSDAAFKLKVGETSAVVESPFGFHIIQRLK